ncbi:CLUMA_CG018865, isoform A [Clunio marinus]|uniref:CLUMA_CG018865, isoform A n=1 Tax=Clunio marinus TaxID=568069 RepID=A0A1J1J2Z3_9DIPT|nr:CLUMA_CG018865, isoform A [Clunio marinus]
MSLSLRQMTKFFTNLCSIDSHLSFNQVLVLKSRNISQKSKASCCRSRLDEITFSFYFTIAKSLQIPKLVFGENKS